MKEPMPDTVQLRNKVESCGGIEEFKESIHPLLKEQKEQWKEKFNEIFQASGYTTAEFAKLCRVSRSTVSEWKNAGVIPKERETFLLIGLAAGYDIPEFNRLLQRYGRYGGLYPKNLQDCVCIYIIRHAYGKDAVEAYQRLLEKIGGCLDGAVGENTDFPTFRVTEDVFALDSEEEFADFIEKNSEMFYYAYRKLYAYINMCLKNMITEKNGRIHGLAQEQSWSSSLRQCISAISQKKWIPTRNKLISIGLHCIMTKEEIDLLLGKAYMEPLCAKNTFEQALIFALNEAELSGIYEMEKEEGEVGELCAFVKEIFTKLGYPELMAFLPELYDVDDRASREQG